MEKTEVTGKVESIMASNGSNLAKVGGINNEGLISTEYLAEVLGVTVQVIRRMVKEKKIPAYQLERVFRFNLDEVLQSLRVK